VTSNHPAKTAASNGGSLDSLSAELDGLRMRIQDLERLCAEVYDAAAGIGLLQPLLNRLSMVVGERRTPHALALEVLPGPPAAAVPMPPGDLRVTTRPLREPQRRPTGPRPQLEPLVERRRVVVVDDDPMMMEALVRILQRENFELTVASNGAEALEKAAAGAEPPELLITDYAMPGMKGRELAERMRERYPALRVLYQTGFTDMLFENKAQLEAGAAYLEKPFTARGLREAARFVLFGAINPNGAKAEP
jgi:CheY-like chemotaxis protein